MEEQLPAATLVSSADLQGSEFVCRCNAEDMLRWSLYSGDYVVLKGPLALLKLRCMPSVSPTTTYDLPKASLFRLVSPAPIAKKTFNIMVQ